MITSLTRATPVLVQGITGRMGRAHTRHMREFGTNIVAGRRGPGGYCRCRRYPRVHRLRRRRCRHRRGRFHRHGPARGRAAPPSLKRLGAGIRLIVTVAEGVPVHDALHAGRIARAARRHLGRRLHPRTWRYRVK